MNLTEVVVQKIQYKINTIQFDLSSEIVVQNQIEEILQESNIVYIREKLLSKGNRIDFYLVGIGICVEVKIKGSATPILRQCKRYCEHGEVKSLLLISSKFMGFPEILKGKSCYFIGLSEGLL